MIVPSRAIPGKVSKKSLIICLCILLLLIAAIGMGVKMLYSGKPQPSEGEKAVSHAGILQAVPSDAALVFCFQNAKTGVSLLDDRTKLFHSLVGANPAFGKFVATLPDSAALKAQPMAVSVHYSETLVPLMILDAGPAQDTTELARSVLDYAQRCGLQAELKGGETAGFLLVSPSRTLVESSCRHLDTGTSILDDPYFKDMAAALSSREVVFFSNPDMGRILSSLCLKPLYPYSTFLKGAAEWTGFDIREAGDKRLRMTGATVSGRSPSYYSNLLETLPGGELRFSQVLPANTLSALALSVPDCGAYVKAYEKWLDASQSLQVFRRECEALRADTGEDPVKWFAKEGVCEVVRASWNAPGGTRTGVVLLRSGKAAKGEPAVEAFPFSGFPAVVFGGVFAPAGSFCKTVGEWRILGSEAALAEYDAMMEEKGSLADALSDVSEPRLIPAKGGKAAFYFSASDASGCFGEWFRPLLADNLKASLDGVIREPMVLSCTADGLILEAARPVDYAERKASGKKAAPGRKADVEVPQGPFEVTNSGTGKTNLFYQAPNLSLCLKDKESGKGLWGVSFDTPICGAAECVDYYANGKLQFLFAAGSKLYLIDRLGRFVSGFPVELGKEVLLGPAVYDFSGAKGYTALVLHRDNTIGMYDLHGVQPAAWQGITCPDTILSLPVLAKADGKRVWVVKTAGGEQVYDFWGGEPLKAKSIKNLVY
jgi:hypothetical protein